MEQICSQVGNLVRFGTAIFKNNSMVKCNYNASLVLTLEQPLAHL